METRAQLLLLLLLLTAAADDDDVWNVERNRNRNSTV
jgi:hypothetical protein